MPAPPHRRGADGLIRWAEGWAIFKIIAHVSMALILLASRSTYRRLRPRLRKSAVFQLLPPPKRYAPGVTAAARQHSDTRCQNKALRPARTKRSVCRHSALQNGGRDAAGRIFLFHTKAILRRAHLPLLAGYEFIDDDY